MQPDSLLILFTYVFLLYVYWVLLCAVEVEVLHFWWVGGGVVDCPTQLTLYDLDLPVVFHDKYQWEIWENTAGKSASLFWSTRSLRWKRISWKMHIWANQKSFTSAIKTENSKVLHQVTWQGLHRSHSSLPQQLHHYPTAWGFTILIWIW